MPDYPFGAKEMLYRLAFYLPGTMALFGVFLLWRRSSWKGPGWRHVFEVLNIGGFSALFLALWFLCGISSMEIEEIKAAIPPLVFGGFLLAFLSYLIYFRKIARSATDPRPPNPLPTASPEGRSGSGSRTEGSGDPAI